MEGGTRKSIEYGGGYLITRKAKCLRSRQPSVLILMGLVKGLAAAVENMRGRV